MGLGFETFLGGFLNIQLCCLGWLFPIQLSPFPIPTAESSGFAQGRMVKKLIQPCGIGKA